MSSSSSSSSSPSSDSRIPPPFFHPAEGGVITSSLGPSILTAEQIKNSIVSNWFAITNNDKIVMRLHPWYLIPDEDYFKEYSRFSLKSGINIHSYDDYQKVRELRKKQIAKYSVEDIRKFRERYERRAPLYFKNLKSFASRHNKMSTLEDINRIMHTNEIKWWLVYGLYLYRIFKGDGGW